MRCNRTKPFGLLLLFACVVYSGGLSAGWHFIKQIGNAIVEIFKAVAGFAMQFPDELGITDWLWTRDIFAVIAISAVVFSGYVFTHKEQKKLMGMISAVVGLISTALTFS